jgi:gluconolactonase
LCFGPDGALYLTDSGVDVNEFAPHNEVRRDYLECHYDGRVYRVDPESGRVTLLDRGLRFANGIAFGPDRALYVNETLNGSIYRYAWEDGRVGGREIFGNVIRPDAPPGWKGPDGMAFDENGLLYVTVFAQGEVTVWGRGGSYDACRLPDGFRPTWHLPCQESGAST